MAAARRTALAELRRRLRHRQDGHLLHGFTIRDRAWSGLLTERRNPCSLCHRSCPLPRTGAGRGLPHGRPVHQRQLHRRPDLPHVVGLGSGAGILATERFLHRQPRGAGSGLRCHQPAVHCLPASLVFPHHPCDLRGGRSTGWVEQTAHNAVDHGADSTPSHLHGDPVQLPELLERLHHLSHPHPRRA